MHSKCNLNFLNVFFQCVLLTFVVIFIMCCVKHLPFAKMCYKNKLASPCLAYCMTHVHLLTSCCLQKPVILPELCFQFCWLRKGMNV